MPPKKRGAYKRHVSVDEDYEAPPDDNESEGEKVEGASNPIIEGVKTRVRVGRVNYGEAQQQFEEEEFPSKDRQDEDEDDMEIEASNAPGQSSGKKRASKVSSSELNKKPSKKANKGKSVALPAHAPPARLTKASLKITSETFAKAKGKGKKRMGLVSKLQEGRVDQFNPAVPTQYPSASQPNRDISVKLFQGKEKCKVFVIAAEDEYAFMVNRFLDWCDEPGFIDTRQKWADGAISGLTVPADAIYYFPNFTLHNLQRNHERFQQQHFDLLIAYIEYLYKFGQYWYEKGTSVKQVEDIRAYVLHMSTTGSQLGVKQGVARVRNADVVVAHEWASLKSGKEKFVINTTTAEVAAEIVKVLNTQFHESWDNGEPVDDERLVMFYRQACRMADHLAGIPAEERELIVQEIDEWYGLCTEPASKACHCSKHKCRVCHETFLCSEFDGTTGNTTNRGTCVMCRATNDYQSRIGNPALLSARRALHGDRAHKRALEYALSSFEDENELMKEIYPDGGEYMTDALTGAKLCAHLDLNITKEQRASPDSVFPNAAHPFLRHDGPDGEYLRCKHCSGNIIVTSMGLNLARQRRSFAGLHVTNLRLSIEHSNLDDASRDKLHKILMDLLLLISIVEEMRPLYGSETPQHLLVTLLALEYLLEEANIPLPANWPGTSHWATQDGHLYGYDEFRDFLSSDAATEGAAEVVDTAKRLRAERLETEWKPQITWTKRKDPLADDLPVGGGEESKAPAPIIVQEILTAETVAFSMKFIEFLCEGQEIEFEMVGALPNVLTTFQKPPSPEAMLQLISLRRWRIDLDCNRRWSSDSAVGKTSLLEWYLLHMIRRYGPTSKPNEDPLDDLLGITLIDEPNLWFSSGLHHDDHFASMKLGVSVDAGPEGVPISATWDTGSNNIVFETHAANNLQGRFASGEATRKEIEAIFARNVQEWEPLKGCLFTFPHDGDYRRFPGKGIAMTFTNPE